MQPSDSEDLIFTILRHCVARGEGGLSPLQARILQDPKPVRIFSAPTGAGKSYALVRAVAAGKRVLFVVPTRRLAQNLAAAAIEELSLPGMAPGSAESLVALWSSDETALLRAEYPDVKIGRLRVRQTRELGSKARFIVATPESIAFMLLWALRPGYADLPFCLADLVVNFDHIVFDEFHTIDARGFGLCAVVARAVAATSGGAKLTFLSATPIDVLPVLSALGLPRDAVAFGAESVVTEAAGSGSSLRAVHGDVEIRFCPHLHMLNMLEAHAAALRECLERGRQVVVILDSLDTLHVNKRDFASFFDRLGVPAAKRLAINSVDDGATPDFDGAFVTDRHADPVNYCVLLATSSVEMGVTFKAGLIAMDPGHDALSFVQRVGRVARGDERGVVLVRYDAGATSRKPWLREILVAFEQERPPRALTVDRFLEFVLRATRQRFTPREKLDLDEPPRDFRAMPARAVWAAALFFHALERAQSPSHRGQREALRSIRPAKVACIAALLRQVSEPITDGERNGAEWARAFLAQASTLRDFTATIAVEEPSGKRLTVPLRIIESRPALATAPLVVDPRGDWVLMLDRPFDEALRRHEKVYREEILEVMLPDGDIRSVPRRSAATEAAQLMERMTTRPGTPAPRRKRFEAAATLVRLSGLVVPPTKDMPALPDDASAVL
jgi:CRISPR-associated helicase Cas3